MATKYRKCFYDGKMRSLFSNSDKANDFINHIPEVISGEHKVYMYKAYYCPKCLGWHVRLDFPSEFDFFAYPNNNESYNKVVNDYKKKCKPLISDNDNTKKEKITDSHKDKVFFECKSMLEKFINWLDDSYNNEYNEKSAKYIKESCNYIDRYITHSKTKNNDEELNNAYMIRDLLYDKSVDMLYMLFSKVDELFEENNVQDSYVLFVDIEDAIKNMNKKMNIDVDVYSMFGELIDMNADRFKHYNKTGDLIIRESRHLKKAKEYTEDAECYASNKDWCTAYEYIQKAREKITTLVNYNMRIYYDECIILIDRLIEVEKTIENIFNK